MLDTFILPPATPEGSTAPLEPAVRILEADATYGKVAIEPLQQGYGITIGNPLRRILLSSIKGSAITWIKIEDVVHEYTYIPGVKEEVMDLLLNIKRIRIHSQSDRTGKMRLEVTGEGRVCAGDISTSADFEVVNPELHLATLDAEDSSLSIEFNVEQGTGYEPAAQNEGVAGMPVGVLPVDAIFNPVRKVDYSVERTRVGQVTDYERLILEVWTDGTITPVEAVHEASDTLVSHFFLFSNLNRVSDSEQPRPSLAVSPEIYQNPIERLDLSPRTLNCLKRAHITRVGEVLEMSDDDLLKIRNFGDKSLDELHEKLAERGITAPRRQESEGEEDFEDLGDAGIAVAEVSNLSPEGINELMGAVDAPEVAIPEENTEWLAEEEDEEDS